MINCWLLNYRINCTHVTFKSEIFSSTVVRGAIDKFNIYGTQKGEGGENFEAEPWVLNCHFHLRRKSLGAAIWGFYMVGVGFVGSVRWHNMDSETTVRDLGHCKDSELKRTTRDNNEWLWTLWGKRGPLKLDMPPLSLHELAQAAGSLPGAPHAFKIGRANCILPLPWLKFFGEMGHVYSFKSILLDSWLVPEKYLAWMTDPQLTRSLVNTRDLECSVNKHNISIVHPPVSNLKFPKL